MADLIPRDDDDAARDYLDLAAIFTSAIPVLGGAVSNVLGGWSQNRRFQRIREVLEQLDRSLRQVRESIREDYIRSDEFEDLLDQTLRRVAAERHEAKRRLYAAFLAGAVTNPGEPYHEKLRILRTLEELQPDHIRIIRTLLQAPPSDVMSGSTGSILDTLTRRLQGMTRDRIIDLVSQLSDELRLIDTDKRRLQTIMTAHGAADLRGLFTPYGRRLVAYIRAADGGNTR